MAEEIILTESPITTGATADVFNQQIALADDDPIVQSLNLNKTTETPPTETKVDAGTGVETELPQSTPETVGTVKPETKPEKVNYTDEESYPYQRPATWLQTAPP